MSLRVRSTLLHPDSDFLSSRGLLTTTARASDLQALCTKPHAGFGAAVSGTRSALERLTMFCTLVGQASHGKSTIVGHLVAESRDGSMQRLEMQAAMDDQRSAKFSRVRQLDVHGCTHNVLKAVHVQRQSHTASQDAWA